MEQINSKELRTPILQAALTDLARGISVIPIDVRRASGKRPAVAWKPYQTRLPSHDEVTAWFTKGSGLGRITGAVSGFVVVDFDPHDRSTGEYRPEATSALAELARMGVDPKNTYAVATPGGGWHAYYLLVDHDRLPTKTAFLPCVDVKGEGGYVVAPPSLGANRKGYTEISLPFEGMAPLPAALWKALTGTDSWAAAAESRSHVPVRDRSHWNDPLGCRYATAAVRDEAKSLAATLTGDRNNALNSAAFVCGQLVGGGCLDPRYAMAELRNACHENKLVLDDGDRAFEATFQSGLDAGTRKPRMCPENGTSRGELRVYDIVELAAIVEDDPAVPFMVQPLWPGDAYGVIGAEKKAGKTWAAIDLAVSVARGLPWFGRFPVERSGSVVVYCGEGGKRNIVRRVRAVCAAKGVAVDELRGRLRVVERVPRLASSVDLNRAGADLDENPDTVCVIIDPLYLAAAGARGSDLYSMGEMLSGIQHVCQDHGAALVTTTHWNKTGTGSGADRFTGVGPAEWGRVLGSARVETRGEVHARPGGSEVTLLWEFTGSEIADTTFRLHRRIWAEDPEDLASPLGYEVEVGDVGVRSWTAKDRVFAALDGTTSSNTRTALELEGRIATDGHGASLKHKTVQNSLTLLRREGKAESVSGGFQQPDQWFVRAQSTDQVLPEGESR